MPAKIKLSKKTGLPLARKVDRSAAWKQEVAAGAVIANQLPKLMEAKECAKQLGISPQALRVIECRTLYKVACRLKELLAGGAY
jgi:hypothetical protein